MKNVCILLLGIVAAAQAASSGGTIVLLGLTGAGKSQLGNYMSQSSFFNVGSGMDAVTTVTLGVPFVWNGAKYVVFDTPGLDDSGCRDTEIIIDMKNKLQGVSDCLGFIYVRNDQVARMSSSERTTLKHLRDVFGQVFANNLVIVSTRARPDELLDAADRADREKRRSGMDATFSEELGVGGRAFPKFFIDTSPKADAAVKRAAGSTVSSMMTWLASNKPFSLGEMKAVASNVDALNADIKAAKRAREAAEAARVAEEKRRAEAERKRKQAEEEAARQRAKAEALKKKQAKEKAERERQREKERKEQRRREEKARRKAKEKADKARIAGAVGGFMLGGPVGGAVGGALGGGIGW